MSVRHTQMNREVKGTNYRILQSLKTKLNQIKGKWMEELYSILWEYQKTFWVLMNESPFNLAFSTKVVIPVKSVLLTMKVKHYEKLSNSNRLRANLDWLEET